MDRFNRIYALHRMLASHRLPVSGRKLQEQLGCSRPTLARIIQEMRDFLGAPIVYDRTRGGYHYDLAEGQVHEIPGLWFSPQELHALLAIQQLLAAIQPGLIEDELNPDYPLADFREFEASCESLFRTLGGVSSNGYQ